MNTRLTFALCHATECIRVTEHVVQSYLCNSSELILTDLAIHDGSTTLVETTDNSSCIVKCSEQVLIFFRILVTLEFGGSNDFHCHDGLQYNWFRLQVHFTNGTDGCQSESQL